MQHHTIKLNISLNSNTNQWLSINYKNKMVSLKDIFELGNKSRNIILNKKPIKNMEDIFKNTSFWHSVIMFHNNLVNTKYYTKQYQNKNVNYDNAITKPLLNKDNIIDFKWLSNYTNFFGKVKYDKLLNLFPYLLYKTNTDYQININLAITYLSYMDIYSSNLLSNYIYNYNILEMRELGSSLHNLLKLHLKNLFEVKIHKLTLSDVSIKCSNIIKQKLNILNNSSNAYNIIHKDNILLNQQRVKILKYIINYMHFNTITNTSELYNMLNKINVGVLQ